MTAPSGGNASGFRVDFGREGATLHARVSGENSYDNTLGYWQAVLAEVRRDRPARLLLVDELAGPALTVKDWDDLVHQMEGKGLEGIRIAHLRVHGRQKLEFCEVFARRAGIDARVFEDAAEARAWLAHGG